MAEQESKFVLKSKTIQGGLLMAAILLKFIFGIELYSDADAMEIGMTLEEVITGVVALVGFAWAVYGRIVSVLPLRFKLN